MRFWYYLRFIILFVFRCVLKTISWLLTATGEMQVNSVTVLMYHRVSGDVPLEFDIPFSNFCKQVNLLSKTGDIISIDEAIDFLNRGISFKRPAYVLTFDDAFEDFFTNVYPFMVKFNLPVTLYVPTGFLKYPTIPPISGGFYDLNKLKPITWSMLEFMSKSPIVTIASHTHSHIELPSLTDSEILKDIDICDSLLQSVIGREIRHFAYPRGIWNERVENIVKDRYASVSIVGNGSVVSHNFLHYRVPRVPVLRSDGMFWFRARIRGRLIYEERLVKFFKNLFAIFRTH